MLSFSISYPDLIEFPYYAVLTQGGDRGWKEAQRECEDRMTLRKTLPRTTFNEAFCMSRHLGQDCSHMDMSVLLSNILF